MDRFEKHYCLHNWTEDFQNIGYNVVWHLFYTQYFCLADSQPHLLLDLNPNSCGVTQLTDLFHLRGTLFSSRHSPCLYSSQHSPCFHHSCPSGPCTGCSQHIRLTTTHILPEKPFSSVPRRYMCLHSYNEIKWHL